MKKSVIAAILFASTIATSQAGTWDWTQIFGSSPTNNTQTSSTIGNILEGLFSRTDITISDMAGIWLVDGSAVAFKSEDFLSKAGGMAGAAALQSELDPYYRQYGLTGAEISIDNAGNCKIKLSRGSVSGIITPVQKGEFLFNITILGKSLSSIPLYVRKTSHTMDMMFDVAKLKQILQIVANLSGNSLARSVTQILDRYQGIYIGFGMRLNAPSTNTNATYNNPQNSGLDALRQLLNGRK